MREQCQLDVAEAEDARRRLVAEQKLLERRLAALQAGMRSSVSPGLVDLQRLSSAGDFSSRLQVQLTELSQQRVRLEEEIARRRQALVEADRDVKTLEKLRERQHQQHEMAARRAGQKLQDDASARSFARESRP
jgi:flagellar export protein FliJ